MIDSWGDARRVMAAAVVGLMSQTAVATAHTQKTEAPGASTSSPLWGGLEPGAFEVGFRSEVRRESARNLTDGSARAVRLDIWYPAGSNEEPPVEFVDYVRHELGPAADDEAIGAWLSAGVTGDPAGLSAGVRAEVLEAPMRASLNVELAPGSHPLVLWTPRHETTPAQSVLCEYLASHGYVVVVSRREGMRLPYPWEMTADDQRHATIQEHMADMSMAFDALSTDSSIATDRIGVLTWSYAAELASLFQMSYRQVAMVIGLSSDPLAEQGVYRSGVAADLPSSPAPASYVVMSESVAPDGTKRQAPRLLGQLAVESFFVRFQNLSHGNFNVIEGMVPGVYMITDVQPWSRGGSVARHGYETIARYVLAFLDHGVRNTTPRGSSWPWELEEAGGGVSLTRFPPSDGQSPLE